MTYLETLSPNGGVENGNNALGSSDFITINTVVDFATGAIGAPLPTNQENLKKLFELIQTTTNAKYIQVSSAVVDMSQSANRTLYALGTNFNQADTTIYTVKFMSEQVDAFQVIAFQTLIDGVSVPNPTVGVPVNGPATETISAYKAFDAADGNISISLHSLVTN